MRSTIISDTSCLILLDNIGELNILHQLFGNITTTPAVATEFGKPLPPWFAVKEPVNKHYQSIIEASVDKGESQCYSTST